MPTSGLSFGAQVSEWVRQEKEREEAVFLTAAQMVANEVRETVPEGGRLPIDTGNLRRSLMASTASMPAVRGGDDQTFADSGVEMVIAGTQLGGTLWLGFQAEYSLRMEFGFVGTDSLGRVYNQSGFGFVERTAQRWSAIVSEAEAAVRNRFEAGSPQA